MKKSKIIALTHLRDKGDAKIYMVVLENGDTGEFYSPSGEPSFKVEEEVEYEIEASPYGPKFKLPKKAGGSPGFARKSPTESALITSSAIVKSMIEAKILNGDEDIRKALKFHTESALCILENRDSLPF